MSRHGDLEDLATRLADADLDSESDILPMPTPPESTASTSPDGDNATLCKECEERSAAWYCEKCEAICEECWDDRQPHRRGDPRHSRIPYNDYLLFGHVLRANLSETARQELHERDHATLWFAVDGPSGGQLGLEEFPRFTHVIGEHRQQYGSLSACYPRLISFIGDTGVGKSSIIRLLIEHPWDPEARRDAQASGIHFTVPVVGRPESTIPTSGDVHLYRDQILDPAEISSPLFYADCEGFNGGHQEPQARQLQHSVVHGFAHLAANFDEIRRWARIGFSYIRQGFRRPILAVNERETAIREMFPRLLYNFSDVVVHVVLSAASRQMENHITKLLEWAHASHAAAVNRLMLPHLIVVLNQSDENSEWDPAETKARILVEQARILEENSAVAELRNKLRKLGARIDGLEDLLKESYSSIQFIRIPQGKACFRLSEQLRLLHGMIRECSQDAQAQKINMKMVLSSKSLDQFFKLAFDHYSSKLDEPFDFLEALFSVQPLPNTLSDNISYMMQRTFRAVKRDISLDARASSFAEALAPVVCSAIALDAVRSYENLPGSLADIFKGEILRTPHNAWKLSNNSYQTQVNKGFDSFVEASMRCEFVDSHGTRCVNRYLAHMKLDRHQSWAGDAIGYGSFESELLDEITKYWETGIGASLQGLAQMLEHGSPEATSQHQVPPDETVVWTIHQANLANLYTTLPSLQIGDIFTCFWCIRNTVMEILPCGHGICGSCLAAMGRIDHDIDSRVVYLEACNLHHLPYNFQNSVRFLLLPKNVGRRILSIDGGGVRGIISLNILAAVEYRMGGKIPISRFFDLIGGTSAGGLVALGLALRDWKVKDAINAFTLLSSKAFTPHSTWTAPQLWKQFWAGGRYQTQAMEDAIHEVFGELSERRIIGLAGDKSQELPTRVFVTATVEDGQKGTVIANYTRPCDEARAPNSSEDQREEYQYDFEPAYKTGQTFKVWEAARATSAAPLYFAPLRSKDHFEYWDGGLFFNNPARAAICEAERIWPSTKGKVTDLLLSVGNGCKTQVEHSSSLTSNPVRSSSRALRSMQSSGVLGHLRMLKNRLLKNMDSEAMWSESFASMASLHPTRYVRLNPKVGGELPDLDDLKALTEGGRLEQIAAEYLRETDTRKRLDGVFLTLVSTSFYFHPMRRSYETDSGHSIIEGNVMCRFVNHSDTMKNFGKVIRRLTHPRIEVRRPGYRRWALDDNIVSKMEKVGVLEIPIALNLPEYSSEVDIRFVADGLGEELISSFPMDFGD